MTILIDPTEQFEVADWQERDLRFLTPMGCSANWSEMGAFKTSTLLWLLERKKVKNALIITSATGKGAYFSDFYKCLPESWELYNLSIHECKRRLPDGSEREVSMDEILTTIKLGKHNYPMILLSHYDVFTNKANLSSRKRTGGLGIHDKLRKLKFDMLACDEAHRLKSRKTQWTVNIKKLEAKAHHVMTGTAFINNPAEMYSLLNFLNPREWSNYWKFRGHFCDEILVAGRYRQITGIKPHRVEEFRKLRMSLGPRRTMAEVHKHIKKPVEVTHEVELNATQRKMFREIKATLQTMDQQGELLQSPNVLSQLNRCRQISVATPQINDRYFDPVQRRNVYDISLVEPSSKLDELMSILDELDDPRQKVVVFSCYKDPLRLLEQRLKKADISYVHMEQKHSETERYRLWHDEFPKPGYKVFMSTLALGGESINLSCAQYLMFLDRSWSPKDMMQAIGRVYRPGQTGGVEVIYINAKNTTDQYVKTKLDTKGKWFKEIFG